MTGRAIDGGDALKGREALLSSTLAASEEQLLPYTNALLERSQVKSAIKDHLGALQDAERAVALSPGHQDALLRLSQAHFDCGQPDKAYDALQRAKATPGTVSEAILASLDRRLRPFEHLPDEILPLIFSHVHADWQSLPSPYQLAHVCSRWRQLALSTPSLWRDTRILRIRDKGVCNQSSIFLPIHKAYRFTQTRPAGDNIWTRQDANHYELLRLCADTSNDSLQHLELELWEYSASELMARLFEIAHASRATLESVSIFHANPDQRATTLRRQHMMTQLAGKCLDLALRCPNLVDVQLSIGEMMLGNGHDKALTDEALKAPPNASFRSLEIDGFGGFASQKGPQAMALFLQRATQLRRLALRNIPRHDLQGVPVDEAPFAIQLLVGCADTLFELETCGEASVMKSAKALGLTTLPQLRTYRHAAEELADSDVRPGDLDGMTFPKLEILDGPLDLIASFPIAPPHVIVRLDSRLSITPDSKKLAEWLLALDEKQQSPRSLTILATVARPAVAKILDPIIDALTPSRAGNKVACPHLTELRIIRGAAFAIDSTGNCPSLQPERRPKPVWREELPWMADVSRVALMEKERRLISQQYASSADGSTPPCKALSLIELEGCFISQEAWATMQASEARFKVFPNPDEFPKLPTKPPNGGRRKKRAFDFDMLDFAPPF